MLAMIFVVVVYIFRRSFTKTRYIIAVGAFVVLVMILVNYAVDTLPEDNPLWEFLKLVQNPSDFLKKVGSDASFGMRYKGAWPHELALWRTNLFTILFGNGIAYVPIADGTYTGVLGNQGIIGLSFFMYVWYIHFLSTWKTKLPFLWILFLFVLVNGIDFDTLVTSYRTVQPYLVCLFVILLAHGGLREQAWGLSTPRLYGVWRKVRWKST